jgi:hypothetical protein
MADLTFTSDSALLTYIMDNIGPNGANGITGQEMRNILKGFSDSVARVTTKYNVPNGIAGLDGAGLLRPEQLPPIAITNVYVVISQAAMLALAANTGDVAVRTDTNNSYVFAGGNPATLANWKLLVGGYMSANTFSDGLTLSSGDVRLGGSWDNNHILVTKGSGNDYRFSISGWNAASLYYTELTVGKNGSGANASQVFASAIRKQDSSHTRSTNTFWLEDGCYLKQVVTPGSWNNNFALTNLLSMLEGTVSLKQTGTWSGITKSVEIQIFTDTATTIQQLIVSATDANSSEYAYMRTNKDLIDIWVKDGTTIRNPIRFDNDGAIVFPVVTGQFDPYTPGDYPVAERALTIQDNGQNELRQTFIMPEYRRNFVHFDDFHDLLHGNFSTVGATYPTKDTVCPSANNETTGVLKLTVKDANVGGGANAMDAITYLTSPKYGFNHVPFHRICIEGYQFGIPASMSNIEDGLWRLGLCDDFTAPTAGVWLETIYDSGSFLVVAIVMRNGSVVSHLDLGSPLAGSLRNYKIDMIKDNTGAWDVNFYINGVPLQTTNISNVLLKSSYSESVARPTPGFRFWKDQGSSTVIPFKCDYFAVKAYGNAARDTSNI